MLAAQRGQDQTGQAEPTVPGQGVRILDPAEPAGPTYPVVDPDHRSAVEVAAAVAPARVNDRLGVLPRRVDRRDDRPPLTRRWRPAQEPLQERALRSRVGCTPDLVDLR